MSESSDYKSWNGMPDPEPLFLMSWEDIFLYARDIDIDLTRQQVIDIFNAIKELGMEFETDPYWDTIERHVREHLDGAAGGGPPKND